MRSSIEICPDTHRESLLLRLSIAICLFTYRKSHLLRLSSTTCLCTHEICKSWFHRLQGQMLQSVSTPTKKIRAPGFKNGKGYPSTGRKLEILSFFKRRWTTDRGGVEGEGENEGGDFSKSVGRVGMQSVKAVVRLWIWRAEAAQIKPRNAGPGLEFVR